MKQLSLFLAVVLMLSGNLSGVMGQDTGAEYAALTKWPPPSSEESDGPVLPAISPLPAEWNGFAVVRAGEDNLLRWSTLTERNSAWFKVEYRLAGEQNWHVFDIVPAAGNSSKPRFYVRRHPKVANIGMEYRLRQIDARGKEYSSGMISIEAGGDEAPSLPGLRILLSPCHPNPTNTETFVAISIRGGVSGTLLISDEKGRTRQMIFLNQNLLPGSYHFRINTATLPVGSYLLKLVTPTGELTQPLEVFR
ncbi:MAG: T9SS type A sorting domain-containing protein [Bacteroidetes bacterium]|nr:T9SS type A sorting domain-containing protein [Bacteroidota bacterium]